ncbi:MAG: glycerol-3-phosphate acyltransferase [Trueperaceae bacterium]|nr:glycerol-3-phosphate acyltransferase [Trueperaceae bacterium]
MAGASLDLLGMLAAVFFAGYQLGGLPFGAWMARLGGRDVFAIGSRSMGTMNVARNVSVKLGVATFLLDAGKGAAASGVGVALAGLLAPDAGLTFGLVAGVGAVVGHAWSSYVGFRGGKALAPAFGLTLPILPSVGVTALFVLVAAIALTRRVTLATVATLAAFPVITGVVLSVRGWPTDDVVRAALASAVIAAVSVRKHLAHPR